MAKYIMFVLFVVLSYSGNCQSYLGVQFNDARIGNNFGVYCEKDFKKIKIGLGISYLANYSPNFDLNKVFAGTGYARNFKEGLGANFGVFYNVYHFKDYFKIYAGYRFFYSHSSIRTLAYIKEPYYTPDGEPLYIKEELEFDAYHSLEHNLGIDLEVNLSKRIVLSQMIGAGVAIAYDLDDRLIGGLLPNKFFTGQDWEMCYFITIGVKYTFGDIP